MKRNELKTMLKPLIKECIKECIFEEGVLSGIIKEVAQGMGNQRVVAESASVPAASVQSQEETRLHEKEYERKRQERIKRLNESMPFGNADVFEGTKEIIPESAGKGSPLSGLPPDDPGVDINGIMNLAGKKWKHLM
jgi:hypothetical protein